MEKLCLQADKLTASYNNNLILNDISCKIKQGEFICLCGPNGSGKSTLLSCLANLQSNSLKISPETIITINSDNILDFKPKELSQKIAYLQQSEYCTWDFTVNDFILQGRFCHTKNGIYNQEDYQIVNDTLELLNITQLKNRLIHQISGGEFQKVRLARALAQKPNFLLLDEPASNLDFSYEPKLMEMLLNLCSTQNLGILLSVHNLNIAARYAQKVFLLSKAKENEKQLICGSVEEIFTNENLFKSFNQKFQIYNHPIYNNIQIC